MAYAHPAYHGGKNHPEQVRKQDISLREWSIRFGIENHNLVLFLVLAAAMETKILEKLSYYAKKVTKTKQKAHFPMVWLYFRKWIHSPKLTFQYISKVMLWSYTCPYCANLIEEIHISFSLNFGYPLNFFVQTLFTRKGRSVHSASQAAKSSPITDSTFLKIVKMSRIAHNDGWVKSLHWKYNISFGAFFYQPNLALFPGDRRVSVSSSGRRIIGTCKYACKHSLSSIPTFHY